MSERAAQLARVAHEGQVDKVGQAYLEHPARVAARVRGDDVLETVAWLHDVVEDTGVGLDELREAFPAVVVDAVDALTKRPDESRDAYYARARRDPIALRVKLADIDDNSDPERVPQLDEATRVRLAAKYAAARAALGT